MLGAWAWGWAKYQIVKNYKTYYFESNSKIYLRVFGKILKLLRGGGLLVQNKYLFSNLFQIVSSAHTLTKKIQFWCGFGQSTYNGLDATIIKKIIL